MEHNRTLRNSCNNVQGTHAEIFTPDGASYSFTGTITIRSNACGENLPLSETVRRVTSVYAHMVTYYLSRCEGLEAHRV